MLNGVPPKTREKVESRPSPLGASAAAAASAPLRRVSAASRLAPLLPARVACLSSYDCRSRVKGRPSLEKLVPERGLPGTRPLRRGSCAAEAPGRESQRGEGIAAAPALCKVTALPRVRLLGRKRRRRRRIFSSCTRAAATVSTPPLSLHVEGRGPAGNSAPAAPGVRPGTRG